MSNPGDAPYPAVSTVPLCILIRRADGQFFDFVAGAFAAPTKPFDPKRFASPLKPDAIFPGLQVGVIPGNAQREPSSVLIEAQVNSGGLPVLNQAWWLGTAPLSKGFTAQFTELPS